MRPLLVHRAERKVALAVFVILLLLLAWSPHTATRPSSSGLSNLETKPINALAAFKHYGPSCAISSADLYQPRARPCMNRSSMLNAMSSGGRIGRDSPYTARGCDMIWYDTTEVCEILGRFSQVMLVGDSMLRHVIGALNILVREDLGYGAVTDWNFNKDER
ncbi:hypothetical protein BX600DRAFT_512985 [Xylariales sp. PMI_506]|nr:hypothetical protein BX600DRAFT_512985 [Xylariales sp. PMI_506]